MQVCRTAGIGELGADLLEIWPSAASSKTAELFDRRPIQLEGFTLRTRTVVVVSRPKFEQWLAAMQFAHAAAESSPYCLSGQTDDVVSVHLADVREESRARPNRRRPRLASVTSNVDNLGISEVASIARRTRRTVLSLSHKLRIAHRRPWVRPGVPRRTGCTRCSGRSPEDRLEEPERRLGCLSPKASEVTPEAGFSDVCATSSPGSAVGRGTAAPAPGFPRCGTSEATPHRRIASFALRRSSRRQRMARASSGEHGRR